MDTATPRGPRRLTEADILTAVTTAGNTAGVDTLLPPTARRITAAVMDLTTAAAIHDAVADVDPDTAPGEQGITFAICVCRDRLHGDHEAWVGTLGEAQRAAVYYPESTVHYLRRLITITPMGGAA